MVSSSHPLMLFGSDFKLQMRAKRGCRQIQAGLKSKSTGLDRKDTWERGKRTEGKNGSSLELRFTLPELLSPRGEAQHPLCLRNSWERN